MNQRPRPSYAGAQRTTLWVALIGLVALLVAGHAAASQTNVTTLKAMFEQGSVDGELGLLYYANHNAFFGAPDDHRYTATLGGELGFTTATLHGFSLRLSSYAQRNVTRTGTGYNRDLGNDMATLGEAYLQWQGHNLRVRAGNQKLHAPFTATYDYRIIPQTYQGVSIRYGDDEQHITILRMYRYKSRINESYARKTNYNVSFSPFGINTKAETDGFWAFGAADRIHTDVAKLRGRAWFFNYKNYANMYFVEGQIAATRGAFTPFLGLQYIREVDDGDALKEIDSTVYGIQLGLKHDWWTLTLNYNHIPHNRDAVGYGQLITPYAHNESSGPLFAQPLLTSTQDFGSGDAYSLEIKGPAFKNIFIGARYSYMDMTPNPGRPSIEQSGYMVFGIYSFDGSLDGLSIANFFAYQTRNMPREPYWENRLAIQYRF